jgi:hypothetical protein
MKMSSPSARDRNRAASCPRTLFPAASSGGANVASPPLPGATVMIPPPIPLFTGWPTSYSHSPELWYSPAVVMTGQHVPARVLVDNPLARHGIHAAERARGTHRRKVAGADGEAALTRVQVDGIRGVTRQRAAALKQVAMLRFTKFVSDAER